MKAKKSGVVESWSIGVMMLERGGTEESEGSLKCIA